MDNLEHDIEVESVHNHEIYDCDCGCNHTHEHHHDSCECEHEHEHHHEHDESCCGHDHEHTEHTHSHEHDDKNFNVSISYHDMSVIASYKFDLNVGENIDKDKCISEFLLDIGSEVEEHGGIIGHIKAISCGCENGKMLSVTYDGAVTENPVKIHKIYAEGVAIVFNVDGEVLSHIVRESYEEIKNNYNI